MEKTATQTEITLKSRNARKVCKQLQAEGVVTIEFESWLMGDRVVPAIGKAHGWGVDSEERDVLLFEAGYGMARLKMIRVIPINAIKRVWKDA